MNVPYSWLKDYALLGELEPKDFIHQMNMTGTETKGCENPSDSIKNVVICRINSIERHPDADRLSVCSVDIGGEKPLQIVTAATNMKQGDLVPVALDDSLLAGGTKIKAGKLRGVLSEGMFCSVEELGLTVHDYPGAVDDGLLILNSGVPGENICDIFGLDDNIYESDIVTNRPDCLSIIGVAREAACTFRVPFSVPEPQVKGSSVRTGDYLSVKIEDDLCKRYAAAAVTDIKIAPSPQWLINRLRAAGVRAINNIVDITNYVMLEYGQPMHAFDYACVDGGKINVRRAKEGETIETLDETQRKLDTDMLVIADDSKPIAVAGVMGGANSEIKETTETVIFESANFFAPSVRKTSKRLGMRTESSSRFEKGLDPQLVPAALARACELVELLGAGTVSGDIIDIDLSDKTLTKIALEPDWINFYLNISISENDMKSILERLGMTVENGIVTVPSFRSDIVNKYDLSEEIAKFYGYDNIPSLLFKADVRSGGYTPEQKYTKVLGEALRAAGLSEAVTYSFVSPKFLDKIRVPEASPERNVLRIQNPLGEDSSVMRTRALPSMLEVLARNYSFRNPSAYLYELATVYIKDADETKLPDENTVICAGFYGDNGDFYTLKGIIETVLSLTNTKECEFVPIKDNPSYHPGRTAGVVADGKQIGIFGQVHPLVCENYGIDVPVYAAEIPFGLLYKAQAPEKSFKQIPKFPAVTRDIALICREDVYSGDIEKKIKKLAGKYLESIKVFDVYKGAQVITGHKSIAYSLTLRALDRTLQDSDIDTIMNKIMKALEEEGIKLRA